MIFIGGTGRCGTTVLAMAFHQDPRFVAFIEPRFIIFPGGLMDYAVNKSITREEFVEEMESRFLPQMIRTMRKFSILPNPGHVYTPKLIRSVDYTTGNAVVRRHQYARIFTVGLLSEIHKHLGTRRIVHKTPHTIVWAGYLQWIFPDSKFIHIIRDPRDICASVVPLKWGPNKVEDFPAYYNDLMDDAWKARQNVPKERYQVVALETLVGTPSKILRKLYRFLEEKAPTRKTLDTMVEMITPGGAHIGRYTHDLSTQQAQVIREQCWGNYKRWLDLSMS